jgi:hypothetical protein
MNLVRLIWCGLTTVWDWIKNNLCLLGIGYLAIIVILALASSDC